MKMIDATAHAKLERILVRAANRHELKRRLRGAIEIHFTRPRIIGIYWNSDSLPQKLTLEIVVHRGSIGYLDGSVRGLEYVVDASIWDERGYNRATKLLEAVRKKIRTSS